MSADGVGYLCALLLAVVFVLAAIAKLRDPGATERSFADLGVPRPAAMARAVPILEVLIAAALLAIPPLGGLAALGSLAFFTTFLVLRLRDGVRAPCACFGSTSQAPLSAANVVGNAFLMVLAVLALATTGPTRPTAADVVLVAVLVAVEIGVHAAARRLVGRAPRPDPLIGTRPRPSPRPSARSPAPTGDIRSLRSPARGWCGPTRQRRLVA